VPSLTADQLEDAMKVDIECLKGHFRPFKIVDAVGQLAEDLQQELLLARTNLLPVKSDGCGYSL